MIRLTVNGVEVECESVEDAQVLIGLGKTAVTPRSTNRPEFRPAMGPIKTARKKGKRRGRGRHTIGGMDTMVLDQTHLIMSAIRRTKDLIDGLLFLSKATGPVAGKALSRACHREVRGMAGMVILLDNRLRGSKFHRLDAMSYSRNKMGSFYIAGPLVKEVIAFLESEVKKIENKARQK